MNRNDYKAMMSFKLNKTHTFIYYFVIALIAMLLAIFYYNSLVVKSTEILVNHTNTVINKNKEILSDIVTIETGVRGFIVTSNKDFLEPFYESQQKINRNLESLSVLTKDNPNQQVKIKKLKESITNRILLSQSLIDNQKQNYSNNEFEKAIVLKGKVLMDSIRQNINSINFEDLRLSNQRKKEISTRIENSNFLLYSIFAVVSFLLMFIYYAFKNHYKVNSEFEIFNKLQQAASQYSLSLIEASRDPLFTINQEGIITDTNQASERATGVLKAQLIGSNFIDYFTEPSKAEKIYKEVFLKEYVDDYPLVIKDHKLTDVLFNGSLYRDENNKVLGAVVVARDVTEQKKVEKELTAAKVFAEIAAAKAEEALKSKQQFLSNMSHEIRTPMNAIIGFTKVVLKTELTTKQKEYVMAIKMSGDAMIVLINDILDLAKVDAGRMTFEKIPFKLNLSVKAMLHLFEIKSQEKNLKLITHYDKNIPEVLVGDPIRLHQIIMNLMSNAIKFTNQGEITVSITQVSENDKEVVVKFEVKDTGIGIKENKIEQIFENFQQATTGTSRIFGGTGLGLAIVKQLIQAQSGTIDVISKFGSGSTFTFVLNFEKTAVEAVLEPEILELNTDIKDTKILVAEDMELNQLLMKTLLDDFGFECEIAANGKIAVEKLQNQEQNKPFDIILMDLQMPEMDGFEATDYIRKTLKSKIPIIALTADVTTVDVAKCKAVGMNDYISKPVDERLLYSKLVAFTKKPVLIIEQKMVGKIQIAKVKYADITYLTTLTKSNPLLMSELINAFLKQTPTLIKTMKQSFENRNWKLLSATIHKMIPSFGIMGMSTGITEMAKKIQEYSNAIELSSELEELVLTLEKVCLQTCIELETELINLKLSTHAKQE